MNEREKEGILRISNEADRMTVVAILYKNGYIVTPLRRKKNGRTYEYFIRYSYNESIDDPGSVKNDG